MKEGEMLKVNIDFAQYISTIEFEPFLGDNIEEYQKAFEEWFYEKVETKTGTLIQMRSKFNYKYLNAQVIIDWINEVSSNSNPKIIAEFIEVGHEDPTLPIMCF